MNARFKYVDATEGIRQLVAELSNAEHQVKSRDIVFFVHSGKRIHLIGRNAGPMRSALVRRHSDFTLGYTTEIPYGDPMQDHQVEVVRDHDEHLYFRESGQLLSPREFAVKLLNLVAVQAEPA
jgi:hypothetical protein